MLQLNDSDNIPIDRKTLHLTLPQKRQKAEDILVMGQEIIFEPFKGQITDSKTNELLCEFKLKTEVLLAYGVYQVEAEGLKLFEYIKGDINSIMGLPIKEIINYINQYK